MTGRFHPLKRRWLDGTDSFRPAPGFRNPHVQTLLGTTMRGPRPQVERHVEWWPTPDGDGLRVHLTDLPHPAAPVAVLVHGLEGSAGSPYILGLTGHLRERGFGAVAFDHRSCGGGGINRAPRLYHTGETGDLDTVVRRVIQRYPGSAVVLAGVSMGANQILKWLGTRPVPDPVQGAAVACPPFDLTVSGPHMDRRQRAYVAYFLRSLIPKALAKEAQFPGILDRSRVRRARSFRTFDDAATAPLHGFRSAEHYYQTASCGPYLADVRVPALLIAAEDDPFNPSYTLPHGLVREHRFLVPAFAHRGGHVGFVAGRPGRWDFWMERTMAEFLTQAVHC